MEQEEYKYDIAFSLLNADHALAQEINDLLADRYSTFLYSERQKEIAGADGELKFKSVFSNEARLVVVLYRKGWGQTPWTRMEEEAIRGRAYEDGYEFVKFIPLDDPQEVPRYLPKVQLWINALRFGTKGAASVIEARLTELGVTSKKESVLERAARLSREQTFEKAKIQYLRLDRAIYDSNKSFEEMSQQLRAKVDEIKLIPNMENFQFKSERKICVVLGLKKSLRVEWWTEYSNSLDGSYLEISLWKGHPPMPSFRNFYEEPRRTSRIQISFQLCTGDIGMWVDNQKITYDAKELAEFILHYYLENGRK